MQAKTMGAPISLETIHRLMRDRNLSELTFEDELALIEQGEPIIGGPGVPGEANHDDEEDQDDRQAARIHQGRLGDLSSQRELIGEEVRGCWT